MRPSPTRRASSPSQTWMGRASSSSPPARSATQSCELCESESHTLTLTLSRFAVEGTPRSKRYSRVPSTAKRRAVRGRSRIAKLQLVGGGSWFGPAGDDGRRLVDVGEWFAGEEELADEFGEAQGRHLQTMQARRDAQQQIGDHGCQDLQADGVLVVAEELADGEMLLDPAEQQLDLPARLVEGGDLDRRALEIVGDEGDDTALVAPDADAAQRDRQAGIAFAGEDDVGVVDDAEAVADLLAHEAAPARAPAGVGLRTRDEEGRGFVDLAPP